MNRCGLSWLRPRRGAGRRCSRREWRRRSCAAPRSRRSTSPKRRGGRVPPRTTAAPGNPTRSRRCRQAASSGGRRYRRTALLRRRCGRRGTVRRGAQAACRPTCWVRGFLRLRSITRDIRDATGGAARGAAPGCAGTVVLPQKPAGRTVPCPLRAESPRALPAPCGGTLRMSAVRANPDLNLGPWAARLRVPDTPSGTAGTSPG